MRQLVVIGTGGFAREVLVVVDAINAAAARPLWQVVGLVADWTPDPAALEVWGDAPYLGPVDVLDTMGPDVSYVIAVGATDGRRALAERVGSRPAAVLVHPSAALGRDVQLGPGTIVCSHVSITTHVIVGRHAHVNLNCTIGHDVVVGDHVTFSPGSLVSGHVTIEDEAMLGTGAILNPEVRVGRGATVGSGAVVLSDVAPGATVVGIPARPLVRR